MKWKTCSRNTTQEGGIVSELRKLRIERGLDQARVAQGIADILHVPKLSATWWAQIENGTRPIPLSKLHAVAQFFYPDDATLFLRSSICQLDTELFMALFSPPEPEEVTGLHLSGPDAERIKKLYKLPAKTRAAIFELIDSISIPRESTSE
jgi:transcriptional regulator with XRE-family HTH domain